MQFALHRCSSAAPPTSPQLLLQAVQSHLHFSQIRSWQEVGVSDHTHTPFRLLYRVSSFESGVELSAMFAGSPVHHTFPVILLGGPKTSLQVSMLSLPRLSSIPQQLLCRSANVSQCQSLLVGGTLVKVVRTTSVKVQTPSVKVQTPSAKVQTPSASLQDCFPFSPPMPSPLSPKLLAGLADRLTPESSLSSLSATATSQTLGLMESSAGEYRQLMASSNGEYRQLMAFSTGEYMVSSTGEYGDVPALQDSQYREMSSSAGSSDHSGVMTAVQNMMNGLRLEEGTSKTKATFEPAPRAPGSPAPFSTAYDSSNVVKRRSCALTCKVSSECCWGGGRVCI